MGRQGKVSVASVDGAHCRRKVVSHRWTLSMQQMQNKKKKISEKVNQVKKTKAWKQWKNVTS